METKINKYYHLWWIGCIQSHSKLLETSVVTFSKEHPEASKHLMSDLASGLPLTITFANDTTLHQ